MDKKKKVLIVEDEIITAMYLRNVLKGMGYKICSFAVSGEKAIKIVENEHPDVVLMDVKLRGKMDGIEAAREIRSRFDIPIIYISGYPEEVVKEKTEITKSYEFLAKPFDGFDAKEAIESVLLKKNNA